VREDITTMQDSWPDWLGTTIEMTFAAGVVIAILGTNLYLLYRRFFRRWAMINLAAVSAVFLGAAASHLVLALTTSDALSEAMENSNQQGLGNDGLASVVAVLTIASVWIGPRLRPWAIGLVVAGASFSFLPGALSVVTLPFDVGVGILAGAAVALALGTRDRTPTRAEIAATMRRDGDTLTAPRSMPGARSRGSPPARMETSSSSRRSTPTSAQLTSCSGSIA
jgi:hypothetical protein